MADETDQASTPARATSSGDDLSLGEAGWSDILGSGALLRKTLVAVGDGVRPQKDQEVTIRHTLKTLDGETIEDSRETTFSFHLGDNDTVQVIELGVPLMSIGERALFRCAPKFAFGEQGKGEAPIVAPNTPLEVDIEVVSSRARRTPEQMDVEERRRVAEGKCERGNWQFRRGEYSFATNLYVRSLECAFGIPPKRLQNMIAKAREAEGAGGGEASEEEEARLMAEWQAELSAPVTREEDESEASFEARQSLQQLRLRVTTNMAASQLKLGNIEKALEACRTALQLNAEHVKAHFLVGRANMRLRHYAEAIAALERAHALEPDNTGVSQELQTARKALAKEKTDEKQLWGKMLGDQQQGKKKNEPSTSSASASDSASTEEMGNWKGWIVVAAVMAIAAAYFMM